METPVLEWLKDAFYSSRPTTASILIVSITLYLIWQYLACAKVRFYYGKHSIAFRTQDGKQTTLAELCKRVTPECRLNPFLFNGHLQTAWNLIASRDAHVYYKRCIIVQEDPTCPGSFAVDFVTQSRDASDPELPLRTRYFTERDFRSIGSNDSKPMLVVLHGLGGGSEELYLRETLDALTRVGDWDACVVISRGCSGTKLTSSLFYNARSTWDLRQTVRWLRKTFPNRPLYGLGFSLGANILTKYLGEEGTTCVFKAAVSVSNPWDLHVGSLALQRSWIGRNLYLRALGSSLKTLFFANLEKTKLNSGISLEAVRKARYLHEFDRAVQLPMWGYSTVREYYRDASSVDSLLSVGIPFLAVNAMDDPIAVAEAIPKEEFQVSTHAVLCMTSGGGHLGWFELGDQRWIVRLAVAFFNEMAGRAAIE